MHCVSARPLVPREGLYQIHGQSLNTHRGKHRSGGAQSFRAAGKSVKNLPAASKFAGKLFQQGISDSHSLLEFSDTSCQKLRFYSKLLEKNSFPEDLGARKSLPFRLLSNNSGGVILVEKPDNPYPLN